MSDAACVELIRAFYNAFDDRAYEESIAPFLAPTVVWRVAGENPLAGTFDGVAAVLDAMRAFRGCSAQTLSLNTVTLVADAGHVVAIHEARAELAGLRYSAHEVDVFHIEGEQISEMWSFSEDQAATDRMWTMGAKLAQGPAP